MTECSRLCAKSGSRFGETVTSIFAAVRITTVRVAVTPRVAPVIGTCSGSCTAAAAAAALGLTRSVINVSIAIITAGSMAVRLIGWQNYVLIRRVGWSVRKRLLSGYSVNYHSSALLSVN